MFIIYTAVLKDKLFRLTNLRVKLTIADCILSKTCSKKVALMWYLTSYFCEVSFQGI